jgi:hypothetical protein
MPIDPETRELLLRWRSLADGNGLPRANAMIRALLVLGIISMAVVVFAVVNKLNPAVSGVAGICAGWMIAERNALRSRLPMWNRLKQYIDWNRVREDLDAGKIG